MNKYFIFRGQRPSKQRGAALIFGLIILLVLSIIAMASMNDTDIQERMAGNFRDKNLAFQSAEAALRAAENLLEKDTLIAFDGTKKGYWPDLNINSNLAALNNSGLTQLTSGPTLWNDEQWKKFSLKIAENTIEGVIEQPSFTIEKIFVSELAESQGSGVDVDSTEKLAATEYFRITARGVGLTDQSIVTVQTTYVP